MGLGLQNTVSIRRLFHLHEGMEARELPLRGNSNEERPKIND